MEPITNKTVRVVSVSGIVLIALSLLISIGLVLALLSMLAFLSIVKWQSWDNFFDLMAIAILGIAIYYLAFGVMSYIFAKKIARPAGQ